jgi:hypothetical protein
MTSPAPTLMPCLKSGCTNLTPYDPERGRRCCAACRAESDAWVAEHGPTTPDAIDLAARGSKPCSHPGCYGVGCESCPECEGVGEVPL